MFRKRRLLRLRIFLFRRVFPGVHHFRFAYSVCVLVKVSAKVADYRAEVLHFVATLELRGAHGDGELHRVFLVFGVHEGQDRVFGGEIFNRADADPCVDFGRTCKYFVQPEIVVSGEVVTAVLRESALGEFGARLRELLVNVLFRFCHVNLLFY